MIAVSEAVICCTAAAPQGTAELGGAFVAQGLDGHFAARQLIPTEHQGVAGPAAVGAFELRFHAAAPGVHLLGDALQIAPLMPKSGHMANGHGKACAAAVVALLNNQAPNPSPTLTNTCYSFVSDKLVVHVASVHKYDTKDRTMKTVPGSGGVSAAMNELEAGYALNWAANIWADSLS